MARRQRQLAELVAAVTEAGLPSWFDAAMIASWDEIDGRLGRAYEEAVEAAAAEQERRR